MGRGKLRLGAAGQGGSGTVRHGVASLGPVWSGWACWGKAVAVGRVMVRSGKYVRAGRFRYGPFRLVTVRRFRLGRFRLGEVRQGWAVEVGHRKAWFGAACLGGRGPAWRVPVWRGPAWSG